MDRKEIAQVDSYCPYHWPVLGNRLLLPTCPRASTPSTGNAPGQPGTHAKPLMPILHLLYQLLHAQSNAWALTLTRFPWPW